MLWFGVRLSVCLSQAGVLAKRLSGSSWFSIQRLSSLCYKEIPISPKNTGIYTYNIIHKSLAVAEMGDRLATVDMGRKVGRAAVPLSVGGSWIPI